MDQLTQYLIEYRYWALLAAALVEGPVTAFVAGSLVALGIFNPLYAFGVLAFKDLVLDTAFYFLGRLATVRPFAGWVSKVREGTGLASHVLGSIEHSWREHPVKLMWVGKIAYGLSAWFLVSAGMAGVPFRKFYLYTLPVTGFQFGGLMVLGYLLGSTMWENTSRVMMTIQLGVAGLTIFFAARSVATHVRTVYLREDQ